MFEPDPNARAVLAAGTLYAVVGTDGWIYFGQVTPLRRIGFLRYRSREIESPRRILSMPIMSEVTVSYPSIGNALRNGVWKRIGKAEMHPDLAVPRDQVQWPVGNSTLTVWPGDGGAPYDARPDDPAIQSLEIVAAWDADCHIPDRLPADFDPAREEPLLGPILRVRRGKERLAQQFPDVPWHALPADWVSTGKAG
ncbi:hypothetical protein KOAAANKH_00400 [Brevundimonas sp. NIBR10]|uniref:hypothetical protein n=1 Tax=Brevundimonas sp. NIBR10 TaxID=3015997 RepID=UPI0022F1D719|nr:hypothetical protein [Brevundimonas sp. NIBR10]WGM45537.1 hypothetical protein KOAAANKH_00400 [Brevundimonas sp. NIBR10]